MELVSSFQQLNLSAIMLKRMFKVVNKKYEKHGIPYEFLLNKVFKIFRVLLGPGTISLSKHKFSTSTSRECEIIEKKGGVRTN